MNPLLLSLAGIGLGLAGICFGLSGVTKALLEIRDILSAADAEGPE